MTKPTGLPTEDLEVLAERYARLVFGIFGHCDDEQGQMVVRVGGSGVFVGPCTAITARHVVRDLFNTNPAQADELRRKRHGYGVLPHWSGLFQIGGYRQQNAPPALWGVTRVWDPDVTDICVLEAAPDGELATQRLNDTRRVFPEWSLLPPPVGSLVEMVGFPSSKVALAESGSRFSFPFTVRRGWVQEVFETHRDRGMYRFPCFSVNQSVDHGFSGGPVFHNGRLCGVVSGGSIAEESLTYVASLWPICLMEIEYPNLGSLNKKEAIGDWFESGRIRAADWPEVKRRACATRDDRGEPYAYLRPDILAGPARSDGRAEIS
jgi:trypsin-like peptidase